MNLLFRDRSGIFGPLVLSWVASISTAFVSAIVVPTIMFMLPKFGNAEVAIRTMNEIYREYEISEVRLLFLLFSIACIS